MFHFTDMQTLLLLIGELTFAVLSFWALAVVIPARNETVDRLANRNKTLEYWLNEIQNQKAAGKEIPRVPLVEVIGGGSESYLSYAHLLDLYNKLYKKCQDMSADNEFLKSVIAGDKTEKSEINEQPRPEA